MIEGTVRARYPARIREPGWNAQRLSFEVVDASTDEVLARVGGERQFVSGGKYVVVERGHLAELINRAVYFRPVVRGMKKGKEEVVSAVVHVHTVMEEQPEDPAPESAQLLRKHEGTIPQHYALHGNHPNPFNPSTTIRYDLPEASHVSLTIYDVLGRKVAELVNGVQEAGFRLVSWDASGVASGVYLARFAATDANGSVRLARVMKLVLAK